MKEEYEYRYPLFFSKHPYQEVTIPESSIVTKLFCKHEMVPLVRKKKGALSPISGDQIQFVCCKCGKLGRITFWEYEGMGYR